jgi:hypothetical protein
MHRFLAVITAIVVLPACGGSDSPANPGNPVPSASPSAAPVPSPTPSTNPYAAACGAPLPAFVDSYGFGTKVQLEPTRNRKVLNTQPQIRNAQYCASVGIPATICNTRREDDPTRVPCDHYMSGISETGRPGPNWFQEVNGQLLRCGGVGGVPKEAPDCELKPENQYLLDVTAGGLFVACGGTGAPQTCGGCTLDQSLFGRFNPTTAGQCRPN